CLIVPISNQEVFQPLIRDISSKLRAAGVYARVDDSGASIGKRYARNDELGTPYGCTERDTTDQLIGKVDEVVEVVKDLVFGQLDWEGACKKLPKYTGVQDV
ncbi:Glycine--tRNA ligase 1, mitochondrial, partial [Tulasnella sp. 417]